MCKCLLSFSRFRLVFSMVSFAAQSFLAWCSHDCLYLPFLSLPEETSTENTTKIAVHKFMPLFSWGRFMISGLIFRSLIQFEFIFVCKKVVQFIFLHVAVQFSQYHLLKKYLFPIIYFCLLYLRLIDHWSMGFFSGFCVGFHWSVHLSLYSAILSWLL